MRPSAAPATLVRKRSPAEASTIKFAQGDIENVLDRLDDAAIDALGLAPDCYWVLVTRLGVLDTEPRLPG